MTRIRPPAFPRIRAFTVGSLILAACSLAAPSRAADRPDPLNDTWEITLGTYGVNADTQVRLDGEATERGTTVDWEKTFGGGSLTRFRVGAQWRFAERHKFEAMWFSSSRSRSTRLDREIEWGGEVYPIDAEVKGTIDYDLYLLDYEYSFLRRDTYEIAATLGAYYASWTATLDGRVDDPNGGTGDIRRKASADLSAPLPVIGLHGRWVFPHDLSLDLFGQWFQLSVNEYSGYLQDYQAKLTWQPRKWVGLGVGYDWFSANGDVDETSFHGTLDWQFDGLMLFYSASF